MIGLLGFRRIGGLLGSPLPSSGSGPSGTWVPYSGTTVLASNTEAQCGFFIIAQPAAAFLAVPSIREDVAGVTVYSDHDETDAVPAIGTIRYSLRKTPVADRFELMARQRQNPAAVKTVDWIVYVVTP